MEDNGPGPALVVDNTLDRYPLMPRVVAEDLTVREGIMSTRAVMPELEETFYRGDDSVADKGDICINSLSPLHNEWRIA